MLCSLTVIHAIVSAVSFTLQILLYGTAYCVGC